MKKGNLLKILAVSGLVSLTSCATTEYSVGVSTYNPPTYYYYDGPIYRMHLCPPPPIVRFDIGPRYSHFRHHYGHHYRPHCGPHSPPMHHRR